MLKYRVSGASLQFHMPPGTQVPSLLGEFYEWAATKLAGSLGFFELCGDRLDDYYVEDGSRRASAFVSFPGVPDGSRVGWWRPDGRALEDSCIVVLGSEGDLVAISGTLEDFLLKLATKRTSLDDLISDHHEADQEHSNLRAWLSHRGIDALRTDEPLADETAALRAWFKQWSRERNELARSSPARWPLATLLRDLIGVPPPEKPWATRKAVLVMTGTQCSLHPLPLGSPLPALPCRFEACARQFREQDASELPEAGLWSHASVQLAPDGSLLVRREYLREPDRAITLDERGLRQDAIAWPRSPYWVPDWLARRIA